MSKYYIPSLILLWACDPATVKLGNQSGDVEEEHEHTSDTGMAESNTELQDVVEALEDDCQDGDEDACEELEEIQELETDCADGDEEACDELTEMLEELQEENDEDEDDDDEDWDEDDWSEAEWEADVYDAYFELYRVEGDETGDEICSSIVEIEISSNGDITGGGTCAFEPPQGGQGPGGEIELTIALNGSGEDEEAYGEVSVSGPNGQPTSSDFFGYCFEYQGTYGFYFEWYYTVVTPQGNERDHYGLIYY